MGFQNGSNKVAIELRVAQFGLKSYLWFQMGARSILKARVWFQTKLHSTWFNYYYELEPTQPYYHYLSNISVIGVTKWIIYFMFLNLSRVV